MNLATIVDPHPAESPALLTHERVVTYGELREMVAGARGGLARAGVRPGDRVILALPNDWPFVVAYLAVLGAGAVAVPVDPTLPGPALADEMSVVGPSAAVVSTASAAALSASGAAPGLVVVSGGASDAFPGAPVLEELMTGEGGPVVDRQPGDLAVLVFTSGTAGPPKAAMLTHGSLLANLQQVQQHPGRAVLRGDVAYGVLPFFHVFGINVVLGLALLAGSSVLIVDRFDAAEALRDIPGRRVRLLAGAPPLFAALAAEPGATGDELRSVRLAISGAAPLPPEVDEAFTSRFGLPLWQGYGLTEASPVVTSSVVGGSPKPGSVGVAVPGLEVRLVDEAGDDALVGDPGEVWVRGPNVFAGYWGDEEATGEVLTPDGWLRTGDVGVVDDDGYLYLVDRAKDLIIVSGFNVYPAEVEDALLTHPDVAEAAVVGVAAADTGEAVKAFVVARPGTRPTPDDLRAHVAGLLARYKCPRVVEVVDALPRGIGGKVVRRSLEAHE
ncbi:MAG TPA: AMP-binding protein [Acidimicrobiales bacterium]|nr:AMP-binding protein [Acidimicrobiales bacterium]